jgi:hypothetical protein
LNKHLFLFIFFIGIGSGIFSQQKYFTVSGTVYDLSGRKPIDAVAVLSTSGTGAITDSLGHYSINVSSADSIWFSMIGKTTIKYPVDTIKNINAFDIMVHIRYNDLPPVKVRNRNYRLDSIENRQEYAKYFNFKKPTIQLNKDGMGFSPSGYTVGLDLDAIINMFRFRHNRNLEAFQQRLIEQEQDKYIDHRFTKLFVHKITKLESPELDAFMQRYRPQYGFLVMLNDLEFGYYIEQCYKQYEAWKDAPH